MNNGEQIKAQVLEHNIRVHRAEAAVYEAIHPQVFNWYHVRKARRDLRYIEGFLPVGKDCFRVLDLGCGTGFLTIPAMALPFAKITAVDLSPEMLAQLEAKLSPESHERISLVVREALDFLKTTTDRYDLIMTSAVLHHLYDFEEFLKLALARLNDGGIFYIAYEPLKQAIGSRFRFFLHRLIRFLDRTILFLRLKFSGRKIDSEHENSLADYQTTLGGIDPEAVLKILRGNEQVLKLDKFATRASGFLAFISDRVIQSQNTFSVIFRKK
ncbi:MAG: class I SAM-dependent methyltransferase [Candidatus Omnitrophota bacterium]